jgi:hypothetical protein
MSARVTGVLLALAIAGCQAEPSDSAAPAVELSLAQLQDPETCKPCHAQHYREWASSMHAYAAKDPVFTAMNERGQRETDGALGEFCVRCHAPMALELGLTRDGLNLPDVADPNAHGVTCYFCHDVTAVTGDHNRKLGLAHDRTLRAGLGAGGEADNALPPQASSAHGSAFSALHATQSEQSASMCGACHDIVNDAGVALERTFAEWRSSQFSRAESRKTCASCHMPSYEGQAAPGGPQRKLHRHMWPGVDTALTDGFPGKHAQQAAIDCAFAGALDLQLTAASADRVSVVLENRAVGHGWPSGAAQDRRAWVELVAYDETDRVMYQSGVIEPGAVAGADEPELELLRDQLFDANGSPVHMFWQATPSPAHPRGYDSALLDVPGAQAGTRTFEYRLPAPATRVRARLMVQAIGLDVIDDFAGIDLPITARVIADVYMQNTNLRSRIHTLEVPGTARELKLNESQTTQTGVSPESSCANHADFDDAE